MKRFVKEDTVWVLFVPGEGWLTATNGDWGPSSLPRPTPLHARRYHSREAAESSDAARNWSNAVPQRFRRIITMER